MPIVWWRRQREKDLRKAPLSVTATRDLTLIALDFEFLRHSEKGYSLCGFHSESESVTFTHIRRARLTQLAFMK
jgi:hypothetical protein